MAVSRCKRRSPGRVLRRFPKQQRKEEHPHTDGQDQKKRIGELLPAQDLHVSHKASLDRRHRSSLIESLSVPGAYPPVVSLGRLIEGQKVTRKASWILRPGRVAVICPNCVFTCRPCASKREVVSTAENCVWLKAL